MFKKRAPKKNSSKRVKNEEDSLNDKGSDSEGTLEITLKSEKKAKADGLSEKPSTEECKDNGVEKNNSAKLSKEAIFKPDSAVEEQYHQLRKNEKLISESKHTQKRDRDGDKIYSGMISHKSRKDDLVKPSSTHVRQNYIMDYQADVCKDFLKNGYCGFGDTCKFLHYREEFKKVESPEVKDWEAAAKRRKKF